MPEWTDSAIILSVRPYGENKGVVNLLTADRGRHAGLIYGFDAPKRVFTSRAIMYRQFMRPAK